MSDAGGVIISGGITLALYLIFWAMGGEKIIDRFYERVTGEKARKGGEETPKETSFSFMVYIGPFFFLWAGLCFVFAPRVVPMAVALAILEEYIGFVLFLRADTFTSTWDGKGYPVYGYWWFSFLVSAFTVVFGPVDIFKEYVAWDLYLFVLSLGLFIATYYLFPDKMPGLKGNYLSTEHEVLKAVIVGIILFMGVFMLSAALFTVTY